VLASLWGLRNWQAGVLSQRETGILMEIKEINLAWTRISRIYFWIFHIFLEKNHGKSSKKNRQPR
jgi:hypothetical protein